MKKFEDSTTANHCILADLVADACPYGVVDLIREGCDDARRRGLERSGYAALRERIWLIVDARALHKRIADADRRIRPHSELKVQLPILIDHIQLTRRLIERESRAICQAAELPRRRLVERDRRLD